MCGIGNSALSSWSSRKGLRTFPYLFVLFCFFSQNILIDNNVEIIKRSSSDAPRKNPSRWPMRKSWRTKSLWLQHTTERIAKCLAVEILVWLEYGSSKTETRQAGTAKTSTSKAINYFLYRVSNHKSRTSSIYPPSIELLNDVDDI